MRRTPWFSFDIKPVRRGWYECGRCKPAGERHYWNGKRWLGSINYFAFPWRGLVKK